MTITPIGVYAASSDVVVVTVTPEYGNPGAPIDFTVVYVSPTQVDIAWEKGASANNTIIRALYGRYPSSYTDGSLVYSGTGSGYSDLNVNFDETIGRIYYRAWSEDTDGDISSKYAEGYAEGVFMTTIAILLIAIALMVISVRWTNIVLTIVATGSWFVALAYTRANPFTGMGVGTAGDSMLVVVLIGAGLATLLYGFQRFVKTRASFGGESFDVKDVKEEIKNIIHSKQTRDTNMNENPDDYTVRVRAALARGKKIKR